MPYPGKQSETERDTATLERVDHALPWKVIVLNDPVNLMSYVEMVFRRVFGYENERARKHMLEVHQLGRSVLWSGDREKAEAYVYQLQHWQLNALLEKDD